MASDRRQFPHDPFHSFHAFPPGASIPDGPKPGSGPSCQAFRLSTAVAVVFFLAGMFLSACSGEGEKGKKGPGKSGEKPPAPVTVAVVTEKQIPVEMEGTGHVEAGHSVDVRPRISGQLLAVHFREGHKVAKGDLLFTVDPAPFKAKLDQALADLERDKAKRNLAARQVKRYKDISDKGYLSVEEYENLQNDVAVLDATIKADQAAVATARLNLSYCAIRAEIGGVVGETAVDPGNQVAPGDSTPLTSIRQMSSLDVTFSVPEQFVSDIRSAMNRGRVSVRARGDGVSSPITSGALTFIDNRIDTATGTVTLKARFDNKEQRLWPGQFVRVVMGLPLSEQGPVIPSQAIQTGQKGLYVYVVAGNTVSMRTVRPGRAVNGETLILEGLKPGETVVVQGQLKLSEGATVTIAGDKQKTPDKTTLPDEKAATL